ncbi:MAG: ferritin-like protein [Cyclobacteriaceae bacterium]
MIKLEAHYVRKIVQAGSLEELFPLVQNAIELEHATIPPYLTAMFSLKPGTEKEIWDIIHSIVIEEMMHMTIAANILNALGGIPAINNPDFVPEYPGPLPMGIGDGLIVGLKKYSKDQVHDVFMEIEEPEKPLDIPVKEKMMATALPEYHTIGEFYMALADKINELAPDNLPGDPQLQVTSSFFPAENLFPILTKADAIRAIDIIVEQGEGTEISPIDFEGEIAHYYRFQELYVGRRLEKDSSEKVGYSFSGPAIPFDASNVWPIVANTKAAMFAPGTAERRRVNEFNASYQSLLNGLHQTFNGQPDHLQSTIGLMFDVKLYGEKLCATPFPGKDGSTIGPPFEFVNLPEA